MTNIIPSPLRNAVPIACSEWTLFRNKYVAEINFFNPSQPCSVPAVGVYLFSGVIPPKPPVPPQIFVSMGLINGKGAVPLPSLRGLTSIPFEKRH